MKISLILLSLLLFVGSCQAKMYDITQYGAVANSVTLNTTAIQKTIDVAAANGGGVVFIPKGVFRSGAIFFKPNTSLQIDPNGVLFGSNDIADYPLGPSRMEGQSLPYYAALVNADRVDNFSVSGGGTIDGNGLKFWKEFRTRKDSMKAIGQECTNLEVHRPRLIFIQHSNHITISGMKLRNSGFWTTHLYKCNNILIENTDIRSPFRPVGAPSTDAMDLDVCAHVVVRGCYMSVNDDAVTIKGGKGPYADTLPENGLVEDVLVENCNFGDSHGSVTLGSECIHAKNIMIRNCISNSIAPLLRMKLRSDTPQLYEDITVENCTGKAGKIVEMEAWTQFFDLKDSKTPPKAHIRNVVFRNVNMSCDNIGILMSNPNDTVENIRFENCQFTTTGNVTIQTNHPEAITYLNIIVNGMKLK